MRSIQVLAVAALSAAAPMAFGETPAATQPTSQELLDEVRALRAEVQHLQGKLESQEAKSASHEQAETVDAVRFDAEHRSTLDNLDDLTAGYAKHKGFFIRSEDGNFLLHPWGFIQVRNATNYRENATAASGDTQNGFELPRMKLIFDGNLFSKDLTYQFIWNTNDTTGNLFLQDAWARYHIGGTPFAVEAGQIRDPLDHEQIVFAAKSMTPERSIVNSVLLNGDGIVKGAELTYGYDTPSSIRGVAAITSGARNFNTSFQEFPTNPASWGVAGRVTWKMMGKWSDYDQFTSLGNSEPLLVFGAGADYTEAGAAAPLFHVIDGRFNLPNGLGLYAAYLGRYTRHDAGNPSTNGQSTSATAASADTYDATVRVMASYLLDEHWEPFVRYEYIHFDSRELPATADGNLHDITLGFNYYLYGHRAKFTAAASYLPTGSPVSNTVGDLLTTVHGGNEVILQAQFQLIL